MKKIITAALALAMLLSASACAKNDGKGTETTAVTTDPNAYVSLTADGINGIIDTVKKEYAVADEVKLSDGTVVSAKHKDPSITIDDVKNGTATKEQKNAYVNYMANIRRIVFDRLSNMYGDRNVFTLETEDGKTEYFIFLDPVADGYANAEAAVAAMTKVSGKTVTDYIYLDEKMVLFFEKGNEEANYLCPTKEENALIAEIMK